MKRFCILLITLGLTTFNTPSIHAAAQAASLSPTLLGGFLLTPIIAGPALVGPRAFYANVALCQPVNTTWLGAPVDLSAPPDCTAFQGGFITWTFLGIFFCLKRCRNRARA